MSDAVVVVVVVVVVVKSNIRPDNLDILNSLCISHIHQNAN